MHTRTIPELAEGCHADQLVRKDDSRHCLELFSRAMVLDDQQAWYAIEREFRGRVKGWVYTYSRFWQTDETVDYFVNEAFARMWIYGRKRAREGRLVHLGGYLEYLKRCAWSAIEDHLRKWGKDTLSRPINSGGGEDEGADTLIESLPNEPREGSELADLVRQVLGEMTDADPRQRLVAEESWWYGFAPREIQSRHPELFQTVAQVYGIKKNLIKRLKNHPGLTALDR